MTTREQPFHVRLAEKMEADGLTREAVALAFGVSVPTVRSWVKGLGDPKEFMKARLEKWIRGGRLPSAPSQDAR